MRRLLLLCDGWQTLAQRAPAAKIMKVWITESWQNVEKQSSSGVGTNCELGGAKCIGRGGPKQR